MPSERIIPSELAKEKAMEAFPYFPVDPTMAAEAEAGEEDDRPIGRVLSSPEEDAQRLASVDHIVHTRLQEAERQAQDIARRAYEEGFSAGEVEGRTFGESQYKTYIQRLEEHLERLEAIAGLFERGVRDEAVGLALAVGEYLALQQLDGPDADAAAVLERVLAYHPISRRDRSGEGSAGLTIRLNPKDHELLGDRIGAHPGVALVPDAGLGRGSLRVESADGVLDATLEQRKERLLELIHRAKEGA